MPPPACDQLIQPKAAKKATTKIFGRAHRHLSDLVKSIFAAAMQRFRSSVSLKAAKLSESFRRKKKGQDDKEAEDTGGGDKENAENVAKESGYADSAPSPVVHSPPERQSPEERERKRRRINESPLEETPAACPRERPSSPSPPLRPPLSSAFGRHRVEEVEARQSEIVLLLRPDSDDQQQVEKVGSKEEDAFDSSNVDDDAFGLPRCVLRGSWCSTRVQRGDVVNVLAEWSDEKVRERTLFFVLKLT